VFAVSAFQIIVTYSASFYRQIFFLSTGHTAVYYIGASLCFISGSVLGGRMVNRFGRRKMSVASVFLAGIFSIVFSYVPLLSVSLAFALMSALFNGMRNASVNNLTLEQVPRFRGLMMSMYSAADNIGMTVGAGLGGYVLLLYDYNILSLTFGFMGIISAIIFLFLARDPILKS
jgi:AAHS family 4-hydroxybenzoate transporter-like MFS transporter